MNIKKLFTLVLVVFSLVAMCACSSDDGKKEGEVVTAENIVVASDGEVKHTMVRFDVANVGSFTVETFPEYAPRSVEHFLKLVKSGYFDGASVEFLDPGKIMKLSDTTTLSSGECKDTLIGEFSKNGYSNSLPITKGTLVFDYLPGEYDSATAKIMFVLGDDLGLDGSYAPFARVTENLGIFDSVISGEVNPDNTPVSPIVMKKVYIKE